MCEHVGDRSWVLHPRPSPVAAAMYTLRDLGADVIVLHGPAGCNFRAARLLERDGVRVVTTSLDQNAVIFGGEDRLIDTLVEVEARFSPSLVGVVGTCCATIIGEDMSRAAELSGVTCKVLVVDCDPYNPDNVDGAIRTIESAQRNGLISEKEAARQCRMLAAANKNEKERGSARKRYFSTYGGDSIEEAARSVHDTLVSGGPIALVLNAKKETSYLYADVLCAVKYLHASLESDSLLFTAANIDPGIGLEKIRGYAQNIASCFADGGLEVDALTGGLDEYAISGIRAASALESAHQDWERILVCGLPHAVPVWDHPRSIAVSTGSRALYAIRELGFSRVLDEGEAHCSVLGANGVVESAFGTALRALGGV